MPSGDENLGAFSLNAVYILSLQTLFERVVDNSFHQRFAAMKRDQVCPSSNKYYTCKTTLVTMSNYSIKHIMKNSKFVNHHFSCGVSQSMCESDRKWCPSAKILAPPMSLLPSVYIL